jgi:Cu(I)/Ag(I) efflux system membrane fusion protein
VRTHLAVIALLSAASTAASAQGIRDRTRPTHDRSTTVTAPQATELTLTLTETAVRPVQVWVRTAGVIDGSRRAVTAAVPSPDAAHVRVGQRVRAFSPQSRSRMYQARVSAVSPRAEGVTVTATLVGTGYEDTRHYILEIITERGAVLSVPNEAILETGGSRIVYVQDAGGGYVPRTITAGAQGELFTEILDGLQAGEQVVTIGSFFIDAEHKLKGS